MGVEELSLRTARVQTAKQAFVRPGRKKTNTASSGFHPTKARGHGIKKRQWPRPTQSRSKKPAAATTTSSTSSTSSRSLLRKAGFFCPVVSESRFATAHRIHARQMHLMKEAISGHLWSSVAIGSKRARCTSRAHGAARGRNQHAISMQSACNQHAISMQSACNQHAISMRISMQSACTSRAHGAQARQAARARR